MKKIGALFLIFVLFSNSIKAQNAVLESYKLVNDINKAENRKAIYMCPDVNFTWADYLKTNPKATEKEKLDDLKTTAIIKAYIGGDKNTWLKNIPKLKSWNGNVNASEFIDIKSVDVDSFYRSHEQTGFYYYSEPLFSADRKKAIVYIWYIFGRLGIGAHYYFCENVNGIWVKRNIIPELGGFVS
jgi:hypothetical protein